MSADTKKTRAVENIARSVADAHLPSVGFR